VSRTTPKAAHIAETLMAPTACAAGATRHRRSVARGLREFSPGVERIRGVEDQFDARPGSGIEIKGLKSFGLTVPPPTFLV
jgi:hypothetical protein